jgi:Ala-tRNA(Pro) deacylase
VAVVPAPAGARALRLAAEDEIRRLYPDCEVGAMPPFGFDGWCPHRVFVDGQLVGEPQMAFNAGTHTDAIRMHYRDFADLVHPLVGAIGYRPTAGAALVRRVGGAECV